MDSKNQVIQWLLDSDPSIRWQVLQDIVGAPAEDVSVERAKITTEGRGATIIAEQTANGTWDPENLLPEIVTMKTLDLLCDMGVDPTSEVVKQMIAKVQENVLWLMKISKDQLPKEEDIHWWRKPFFDGEVEPCINGRVLKIGSYFGVDMQPLVERLLSEQMEDGGWNCDQEAGSIRGSFHSTIIVLEGLLEFELANGNSPAVTSARERGQEYLLKRNLFKRLSTGESIVKDSHDGPTWTQFSYPAGYRYDILRGLDYLRKAKVAPEPRMAEAIEIIQSKRKPDGRWPLGIVHEKEPIAELDTVEGSPSYWNTLRAMRVLEWYSS
jgi:hypothetical protein